jgi:dihydroorotate dehydrogenase electron transfer subunit
VKKKTEDLRVIANERLNEEYFELVLRSSAPLPDIFPGQFAEVRVEGSEKTFLRRPISFFDIVPQDRTIHLLIQEVGAGTRRLGLLGAGDLLNMIYPLGHPFSVMEGERFLLVAGGVGIAPMLLLGKELRRAGKTPVFLFGFRSAAQMFDLSRYVDLGEVFLTTEDGSVGQKGLVTRHPVMEEAFDGIYTCGPEPMMKAVAAVAARRNLFCEASLETLMACGIGACLCCAVPTVAGMQRACVEGPVFNTKELIW